jgi:hypothetical protein
MTEQEIVEFWRNLCFDILSKYSESKDWKPWLEKKFLDGTLMDDSNPMYDLINDSRRRAVRIIPENTQIPSEHSYAVWLNKFGAGMTDANDLVEEMVFTYRSHQESSQTFLELFDAWVNPETTYDDMQSIIASK